MSILIKHYELGMFVAEPVVIQSQAEDLAGGSYGALGIISAEDIEHKPGPIEEDLPSAMAGSESAKFPWRSVVLYGWIAASLILAGRLLLTFALGVRLLGRALPLECERIEEAVHLARAKLGIDKDVSIYSSRSVRSPVIWCWRRNPVLLVSNDAGRFDNGIDWAGVLSHELAHWKRRDHISGLFAELVVCILPWHPLVWWAKSRLVRLSEQACDDWVVATGQPGTDYAESLLDLAPQGQMAFVPAVVGSKRGLAGRVRRILKDSCGNPRTGAVWALAVSIVAVCIAVGVAFAQTRPASIDKTKTEAPPEPEALKNNALPADWTLDYDDGLLPDGRKHWLGQMAENLASLKIMLKPYDPLEKSLKGERYEFRILSLDGKRIGDIHIRPESEFRAPNLKILKPDKYLLKYERGWGKPGYNFRMRCGEFLVDLSRPGMYELRFTPRLGTAEITGSLGGCYAINFEKVGKGPRIRGFAYQHGRPYLLDGLPAGKYRLSAVTQRQSDNVFVSQAEVTVGAGDSVTVNMARSPMGSCSLKGSILGRTRKGTWFILIRKPGSGAVKETNAYEARTMDSLYVVRGSNIEQQTENRARYHIEGVAPGSYTVTVTQHPPLFGVLRQQSKPLLLRAGEKAVLDFDLRDIKQEKNNPSSEPDDGKAEEELWTALPARANNSTSRTKLNKILDAMLYHDKSAMPIAMHVEIEMYNLDKPTDSRHYSTYSFEQRLDGLRLDSAMTVYHIEDGKRKRTQENRRVFTGNQFVYRQQSVHRPGRPLHASLKSVKEAKRIMAYYHLWGSVLLGYLDGDQKPIAAILKDSLTVTLQDQMEVVRGFACHVIEGKTDHGSYKIWIDPEHNYRIRKSIVDKGPGDIYFGKPIPKNAPEDRWATATVHMEISDVKLERVGDHFVPTAETMTVTRMATDGGKHRGQMVVKRSKIDLHPDFERLGAFVMDGIPEGTVVTNSDPQSYGYKYEWRDGKVVPVGDGGTIFGRIELTGNVDLDTILAGKNQFKATISNMPATKDLVKEAQQHRIGLQVTEDGSFRIENVPAGRHLLHISLLKFTTVDLPSGGIGIRAMEIGSVDHEFSIREKVEGAQYESIDLGVLKMAASDSVKPVDEVTNTAVGYRVRQSNKTKPKKTYRERVVHFPKDRSMGTLYIRDVGPDSWYESWQKLGEATGDISIPAKKEVKLEISAETAGDLSSLAMLRADDLQMLSSGWKPIKIGSLAPIGSLKGLKALNLQSAKFDSEDFKHLTGLRQLEVLRLGDHKLTDRSMEYIGQLTSLRSLALWGTGISDEGLKHLQGLTNLTFLALNGCKITDEGISYLKNMTALEGLQLTQTKITDEGLAKLKNFNRLKSLLIGHTNITDAGLEHLQGLTSLENIWINSNPITDEGLAYLSGMKNLKELYATGTKITDAGLLNLRGLKDFHHLIIDSIGDEGIAHLSELPALKLLQIQDAQVTEASIPDFKKMESIKEVLLSGDKVDDQLLDALRNPLPNCKIWDPQRSREYPMPMWRRRFEAVYRLEDGQILKRIAPPFIPERKDYYVEEHSFQASAISRPPDSFYFHWVRKLKNWGLMFGIPSLDSTLRSVLRLKSYEYDGPKELLAMELLGDWIVRDEASQKEKLAALEQVLADELGRYIRFEKRTVEQEVIVATGRFRFRPLPEAPSDNRVYMFSDIFGDRGGGGSTAESVPEFLLALGNQVGIPVIDQTQSPDEIRIPYNHRHSSYLIRVKDKTEKAEKLRMMLDNLTKQTELKFEISLQPVEVWFVTEQNNSS